MDSKIYRLVVEDIIQRHELDAEVSGILWDVSRLAYRTSPCRPALWILKINGPGGPIEIAAGETEDEMWREAYATAVGYIGLQWKDQVNKPEEKTDG